MTMTIPATPYRFTLWTADGRVRVHVYEDARQIKGARILRTWSAEASDADAVDAMQAEAEAFFAGLSVAR